MDQRAKITTVVLSVVALVLGVFAFLAPGISAADVNLNDGGIWVTSTQRQYLAHLNFPAKRLDAGLRVASDDFDVDQQGDKVFLHDVASSTVSRVNAATVTIATSTNVPVTAQANVFGGNYLVADSAQGVAWLGLESDLESFIEDKELATLAEAKNVLGTLSVHGKAFVLDRDSGKLFALGGESPVEQFTVPVQDNSTFQLATVGDQPVVLDQLDGSVYLPGGTKVSVPGTSWELQEVGPAATAVLIANDATIISVPLGGGQPTALGTTEENRERPVRPVNHRGCAYGAWPQSATFERVCEDAARSQVIKDVAELAGETAVKFRTNRDVIVLNSLDDGKIWLPENDMFLLDDWDNLITQIEQEKQDKDQKNSSDISEEQKRPDRKKENSPPTAKDDTFGVRPGRSTVLPVLLNDSDPDGDYITASPDNQPSGAEVSVIRQGGALQVAVPSEAPPSMTFKYAASDGRGGVAHANVTLRVRPESENDAPLQRVVKRYELSSGGSATFFVLNDWIDPDGDPVILQGANAVEGLHTRINQDGSLEVTADRGFAGEAKIKLVVSDGRKSAEGEIRILVKAGANLPPVANGDHFIVRLNEPTVLTPMLNDIDPDGDPLRLVSVKSESASLRAEGNARIGTVSVTGTSIGTGYLSYVIADGPATATGYIRVDVVDADQDGAPVPEDDIAVLPLGGSVLVDLIANDYDPAGGVLTVQSLDLSNAPKLKVALLGHQVARVTAAGGRLEEPTAFQYTVTNGKGIATGRVQIIPGPALNTKAAPIAKDDTLVVRTGDVGSVRVMENDSSPANLKLTMDDKIQTDLVPEVGTPFVSDGLVRLRAGQKAGTGRITYTIRDDLGNIASALVHVTVVERNDESNTAPKPKELVARAVSGQTTKIPIELNGIDPEGDSVVMMGLGRQPQLGVVKVFADYLEYTPTKGLFGTDSFTYLVQDRWGKVAEGRILVGVSKALDTNQPPVAGHDLVSVRPGTQIAVNVLKNDSDPDGDPLTLIKDTIKAQDPAVAASVRNNRAIVKVPEKEGTYTVSYQVGDQRGGIGDGVLTLEVTPNAPEIAPIARDDAVTDAEVIGKETVTVPILKNDEDPDGDITLAKLSSADEGVTFTETGEATFVVAEEMRIYLYTVTDASGLKASAVVRVPGKSAAKPGLDPNNQNLPLRVKAGENLTFDINDVLRSPSGKRLQLISTDQVKVNAGWDGTNLVKSLTQISFTPVREFSGTVSINVVVTDSEDLNKEQGNTASVAIPVIVLPADNVPPVVTPVPIEVGAGEPAQRINLASFVKDDDPADDPRNFGYSIAGYPSGVTGSISGNELTISAAPDAQLGTREALSLTVDDGAGHPVSVNVPLTVRASSKPRPQASTATITTDAGKTETVDIATYVTNPFPDQPLEVSGIPQVTEGQGSVKVQGTKIAITSTPGTHGTLRIIYTALDATKSLDRAAQGEIVLTVRDKPDVPTDLVSTSYKSKQATLSWTAGSANGTPITKFTIYDETQKDSFACPVATTCTITGRTNGVEHVFRVSATNEVGESELSSPIKVMVDVKPNSITSMNLQPGDQEAVVSWGVPVNEGSPIDRYLLSLSGRGEVTLTPGQLGCAAATGTCKYTYPGLRNGDSYAGTVKACNREGCSEAFTSTNDVIPYGQPGAPGSVTIDPENNAAAASAGRATVRWSPADTNGRAIEEYVVTWSGAASGTKKVSGNVYSTDIQGISWGKGIVVQVRAINDKAKPAGHTSDAGVSNEIVMLGALDPPKPVSKMVATGADGTLDISGYGVNPVRGWTSSQLSLEYSTDNSSWKPLTSGQISGLNNGQSYSIWTRQKGTLNGKTIYSAGAKSTVSESPFGPPKPPYVELKTSDTEPDALLYSANAQSSANGRSGLILEVHVAGREVINQVGDWVNGKTRLSLNTEGTARAKVCYKDHRGICSNWSNTARASTWGNPWIELFDGGSCPGSPELGIPANRCVYISMRSHDVAPGTNIECYITNSSNGTRIPTHYTAHSRTGHDQRTGWRIDTEYATTMTDACPGYRVVDNVTHR